MVAYGASLAAATLNLAAGRLRFPEVHSILHQPVTRSQHMSMLPSGAGPHVQNRARECSLAVAFLDGGPPHPEPRPRRLLADASRNRLLLGDGRGEKVHLGFAVGAGVPSGVGEAGPVKLCDLFVFACCEKAFERLRLYLWDEIAPKVGA